MSPVAALQVGATIEDLDIHDLEELIAQADNEDIRTVYQNLLKGSGNHLRAFWYELSLNGGEYEAQYISAEELAAIVTSERERGRVDADGNVVDNGGAGCRSGKGKSVDCRILSLNNGENRGPRFHSGVEAGAGRFNAKQFSSVGNHERRSVLDENVYGLQKKRPTFSVRYIFVGTVLPGLAS